MCCLGSLRCPYERGCSEFFEIFYTPDRVANQVQTRHAHSLIKHYTPVVRHTLQTSYSVTQPLPKRDLDRLQSVINAAARLTTGARRYDHVTLLLKDLHWLRVPWMNYIQVSAFSSTIICMVQRHATYKKSFSLSLKSLHDVDCGHHLHMPCWCR